MQRKLPSRIFDGFNPIGQPCPVCGTKANVKVVLAPIPGTEKNGLVQCNQIHLECWKLLKKMAELEKAEMEDQAC